MVKDIVICCDGTGNEIEEHQSNVLKFYRTIKRSAEQVVFYDPGVGTITNTDPWSRIRTAVKGVFGLAFGSGLDANVLDAYRFLIRQYEDGDRIWLFGYSRGAYTVRVLGGLLHAIGILKPHQEHLFGYALTTYKQSTEAPAYAPTRRFRRVLGLRRPTIHFMGCWDTVGSVIVPRFDRFPFILSLQELPYTKRNPSVRRFRHALALDERRRMFRVYPWERGAAILDPKDELEDFAEFIVAMNDPDNQISQDSDELWFPGVHGDIGGGYPEHESAAAKAPLKWMIDEARAAGLGFDEDEVRKLVLGLKPADGADEHLHDGFYIGPNAEDPLHISLRGPWRALEIIPKRLSSREWPGRRALLWLYIPWAEPRRPAPGAALHISIRDRRTYGIWTGPKGGRVAGTGMRYAPINLPPDPVWRD